MGRCKLIALLVTAALLAACGGSTPTPTPAPTATPAPPTATPSPLVLLGTELIAAPTVKIACDTGQGAQINCARTADGACGMTLLTNASAFARCWVLQLGGWRCRSPATRR